MNTKRTCPPPLILVKGRSYEKMLSLLPFSEYQAENKPDKWSGYDKLHGICCRKIQSPCLCKRSETWLLEEERGDKTHHRAHQGADTEGNGIGNKLRAVSRSHEREFPLSIHIDLVYCHARYCQRCIHNCGIGVCALRGSIHGNFVILQNSLGYNEFQGPVPHIGKTLIRYHFTVAVDRPPFCMIRIPKQEARKVKRRWTFEKSP